MSSKTQPIDKNCKNVIQSEFSFEIAYCVPSRRQHFVSVAGLQGPVCGLVSEKGMYWDFYILIRVLRWPHKFYIQITISAS